MVANVSAEKPLGGLGFPVVGVRGVNSSNLATQAWNRVQEVTETKLAYIGCRPIYLVGKCACKALVLARIDLPPLCIRKI